MSSTFKFNNSNTLFSKSLRSKTNAYFKDGLRNKTGDRRIFFKAGILLLSFILLYSILVFVQPHWSIGIVLSVLFGANLAAIGFNIMHDAGHDSFSNNKTLNYILSYSLNLLGGNIFFWKIKHNVAHHTYTNIEGEDHDIEIKFMRIHEQQEWKKHHRYQSLYFVFLYSISYFAWIFYQDYEKYFRQRMGMQSATFRFPPREKLIFWISKVIHFNLFVVIPIIFVGWLPTLIGLLIAGSVCGLSLATVFQLAHVVSETEFKTNDLDDSAIRDEWMLHQIQSTANFATRSKVLTWLLGGLNFQVEHHLFPKISHVHYPAINQIVQETCREFNVSYIEFRTFWHALQSHVKVIQLMSK